MNTFRLLSFSAMVAMAGLPLYIYLPHFAVAELGIGMGKLGIILLLFRLFDMIQDPFLGRILDTHATHIGVISLFGGGIMALGFAGVFVSPFASNLIWFSLFMMLVFTGYSLLNLLLYRQSSLLQDMEMPTAARTREVGLLLGVIFGATFPYLLEFSALSMYQIYGITMALLAIVASALAVTLWRIDRRDSAPVTLSQLHEVGALRLLALVMLNTLPIAITSTLFLFFIDDRLNLSAYTGFYSALFFLASLFGVILFSRVSERVQSRHLLLVTMSGAILSFFWAFFLSEGAVISFALITFLSGLFLGCELYLLPVLFARLLQKHELATGAAFGVWSFLTKLALALAAGLLLPILTYVGFEAGGANTPFALNMLAICYALVPCVLKLGALALVYFSPEEGL